MKIIEDFLDVTGNEEEVIEPVSIENIETVVEEVSTNSDSEDEEIVVLANEFVDEEISVMEITDFEEYIESIEPIEEVSEKPDDKINNKDFIKAVAVITGAMVGMGVMLALGFKKKSKSK